MFADVYKNKKVLITGHTGFKGSWLSMWLLKLGADVVGVSKDIPTKPSMFEELQLSNKVKDYREDIRDLSKLSEIILTEKPDFLFHLAAQPIVSISYSNPVETISSNLVGTANILEALRVSNHKCVSIIITSDKAYENVEQVWGYKEDDKMGGKDIYSGSKGAAELIIKSYYHSFFKNKDSNVKLAIGRAGNVIGGGDWAENRIVVDCMKSWSHKKGVEIRNPDATRPWQHVLEPLSGYLNLGQVLIKDIRINGEGFNFGPKSEQNQSVKKLVEDLSFYWNFNNINDAYSITNNMPFHEAEILKLNCDKAMFYFKWQSTMDYSETIRMTSEWYYNYFAVGENNYKKTQDQITEYENIAFQRRQLWTE